MFSGIIESLGRIDEIRHSGTNVSYYIQTPLTAELRIDQSVSHNGVCLTVEELCGDRYRVTAVQETLAKTNLREWQAGQSVNLERCLKLGDRLDGHIVQGHVDTVGRCEQVQDMDGSWLFNFSYPAEFRHLIVEKGSIAVNGVSLTAFNCVENTFSVTIIPYTYSHTSFNELTSGMLVNLEFDILGKYILRWADSYGGKIGG